MQPSPNLGAGSPGVERNTQSFLEALAALCWWARKPRSRSI